MSDKGKLQRLLEKPMSEGKFWTDRLHLVSGCSEVSPGCVNCWLRSEARMRQHHPNDGVRRFHEGLLTPDQKHWNGEVRFNDDILQKVLPVRRNPAAKRKQKVWAVWSDLFHESLDPADVSDAFDAFEQSPDIFIVVTKRPHIASRLLANRRPLCNVIILVTIENQDQANRRASDIEAMIYGDWQVGVLCEPLLGPINLHDAGTGSELFWIITGGESGPRARRCDYDWVRGLRDQAVASYTPFFFKSFGSYKGPGDFNIPAGCLIDGELWMEVPEL